MGGLGVQRDSCCIDFDRREAAALGWFLSVDLEYCRWRGVDRDQVGTGRKGGTWGGRQREILVVGAR